MVTGKALEDMTPEELSEAEPILFPKPLDKLTDEELLEKVSSELYMLHSYPAGFDYDDHLLFTELKNRFETNLKKGE